MSVTPSTYTSTLDVGQSTEVAKTVDTSDVKLTITPTVESASPGLSVSFSPPSETIFAGESANFSERIAVDSDAKPGSTLTAKVDFLINGQWSSPNTQQICISVPKHATTLTVDNTSAQAGQPVKLSATLIDAVTGKPIQGETITFDLNGNNAGSGTIGSDGKAYTMTTAPSSTGQFTISALFAGDDSYLSSKGTGTCTVYAYPSSGEFVVGSSAVAHGVGTTLNFWNSNWASDNGFSGSDNAFKGHATSATSRAPGGTWTGSPGASGGVPGSVPTIMAVLVTSSMSKSGNEFSGNITQIALVEVTSYSSSLGQGGKGTYLGPAS